MSTAQGGLAVEILEANLERPEHQRAVVALLDAYASDPMGDNRPLADNVKAALIPGLRAHPTTLIFLAYRSETPVGIAVCFRGFSTFAARPLINIHDLAVLTDYRGQGVGRQLIAAVEAKARQLGCCKLTLEVQEDNARARRAYAAAGFERAVYHETAGGALFLWKRLGEGDAVAGDAGPSKDGDRGTPDRFVAALALPNAGLLAMAKSLLEQVGIPYYIRNQSAQDLFGLLVMPPTVMVAISRVAEARELLEPLVSADVSGSEAEVDQQPAGQD